MRKDIIPPYLGAAYYPEAWGLIEIDTDIKLMKKAGFNIVRIAEFSWGIVEKKEKEFSFDFFHIVLNRLMEADIGVIMCTPTANPPVWLMEKYPEMFLLDDRGFPVIYSGRRQVCFNNINFIEHAKKIVTELGKEFGLHENILGWQIGSVTYINEKDCFCPTCIKKFKEYLSTKYNNKIEKLNAAWNLAPWSQSYSSFGQIPPPFNISSQNPHLQLEWFLFQSKTHADYIHFESEILRQYTTAPISADIHPFNSLDHAAMNDSYDLIMFNRQNTEKNPLNSLFWFDYIRNIKKRPFGTIETLTSRKASSATASNILMSDNFKPEGYFRLNSWLPIAMGGESNLYRLWRSNWDCNGLIYDSVISSAARPLHMFGEIQKVSEEFKKAAEFINNTKVTTKAAMHYTFLNRNIFETQAVIARLNYQDTIFKYFYKPITENGLHIDIIGSEHGFDDYKLIFSPILMTLEENELNSRIDKWVYDGGIWVTGPLTDIRDINGAKYKNSPFGFLEKMTNIYCKYQISDNQHRIKAKWADGTDFKGNLWYDAFEIDDTDDIHKKSMVKITDSYNVLNDKSIITVSAYGKGFIIVLGTFPSEDDMKKVLEFIYSVSDVTPYKITGEVAAIPREGIDRHGIIHKGIILCEYGGKKGSLTIEEPMLDILSEKMVADVVNIDPYDVMVLKEI